MDWLLNSNLGSVPQTSQKGFAGHAAQNDVDMAGHLMKTQDWMDQHQQLYTKSYSIHILDLLYLPTCIYCGCFGMLSVYCTGVADSSLMRSVHTFQFECLSYIFLFGSGVRLFGEAVKERERVSQPYVPEFLEAMSDVSVKQSHT